jgi:exonuclease VII small subunit
MNIEATIKGPDEPAPTKFADAYAELQAIATKLKPTPGEIPDVDAIEPLVKRANLLAAHCQERIESVRKLIGEQSAP